jgi:hypothetical protein
VSKKFSYPVPRSTLGKDFSVFRDPGFLVVLGIYFLMVAAGIGITVWASSTHGIPPIRF